MESSIFTKSHEFNPTSDNLTLLSANYGKNPEGWGSVEIRYMLNSLHIQTPKLTTPFGFSRGFGGTGKDLNIQVNLDSNTEKSAAFLTGLRMFETTIIKMAWENRVAWNLFGNQTEAQRATLADVKAKFNSIVKDNKNDNYPPTLKASFDMKYDHETKQTTMKTQCTDDKNVDIEPSESTIPRRAKCILQLRIKSLWISPVPDRKFGCKFLIERIKVYPPEDSTDDPDRKVGDGLPIGKCLLDDSDDEEN
jgi:hypothetical protein